MIHEIIFENDLIVGTKMLSGLETGINYIEDGEQLINRALEFIGLIRGKRRVSWPRMNDNNTFFTIVWTGESYCKYYLELVLDSEGYIIEEKLGRREWNNCSVELISVIKGNIELRPGFWKLGVDVPVELEQLKHMSGKSYIYPIIPHMEICSRIIHLGLGKHILNTPKELQNDYYKLISEEYDVKEYVRISGIFNNCKLLRKIISYMITAKLGNIRGINSSYWDPTRNKDLEEAGVTEENLKELYEETKYKFNTSQIIVLYNIPGVRKINVK